MSNFLKNITAEKVKNFFLFTLFISMPFSVAGDDFAVIGLYLVTLYLLYKKEITFPTHYFIWGLGAVILAAIISALFSGDATTSFGYFRKFWRYPFPLFIVIALRGQSPQKYIRVLLVFSGIIGLYAIIQAFTGMDFLRSTKLQGEYKSFGDMWHSVGVFSHHLTFGGVFLLLFSLFTPPIFNKNFSKLDRKLYAVASLITLVALFLSMGRSIWLGAILSIVIILGFSLNKKIVFSILIISTIAISTFFFSLGKIQQSSIQTSPLLFRISSVLSLEFNRDRIFMWKAGVRTIADNPILGIGPNMGKEMQPYYDQISKEEGHIFFHPAKTGVHNIYLQTWVNFGLLGILGYLFWWFSIIFHIIRRLIKGAIYQSQSSTWLLGLLAGFSGCMLAGVFENNFRDAEVQVVIFTFMGLAIFLLKNGQKNYSPNGDDKHKNN